MLMMLKNWKGKVEINGKLYDNIQLATNDFKTFTGDICIKLHGIEKNVIQNDTDPVQRISERQTKKEINSADADTEKEYKITVKQYMTRKATPEFDFMKKFNDDNPMPLRTMTGTIEKQTRGMYYMHLHGQADAVIKCLRCGRELTNPISRHYGIGPECIHHIPVIADLDINDVENIKEKLTNVTWSGWVIKSSITEMEEI